MLRLFSLFFAVQLYLAVQSQCVSTFPYLEDFEANNGNWQSGGTVGNDWAWGSPIKPVINSAFSGSKCWVVGGLAASTYSSGERSFVQSPCFDFTNLQYPFIALSIFWESEKTYDGSNLQYSIDGGNNWMNVGNANETPSCLNSNWYNSANVTNLAGLATSKEGWTGNVQQTSGSCQGGNGSGAWVLAQHCLSALAGEPNVFLRFTFGAGTSCNDYDGIAFDHVSISKAPANTADFTSTCNGNSFVFTGITTLCPDLMKWDFGDGSTATGISATHAFASSGVHQVNFSVSGPCNAPATITKPVDAGTLNLGAAPATCNGIADGKAFINTVTGNGPFSYVWSTNPVQTTDTAFGLSPGDYTVTVSSPNACDLVATVTVPVSQQTQVITLTTFSVSDSCLQGKGTAGINILTGTSPFSFIWTPAAPDQAVITSVDSGFHSVHITDASGCNVDTSVLVGNFGSIAKPNLGADIGLCLERPITLHAGNYSSYLWQDGSSDETLRIKSFGEYAVIVSNSSGCKIGDTILVYNNCNSFVYFPTAFSPNNDGVNDFFRPRYSEDLIQYQVAVYNRWGELVYESTDVNEGWDGRFGIVPQQLSVYTWMSSYSFRDGKRNTQAGTITIVK